MKEERGRRVAQAKERRKSAGFRAFLLPGKGWILISHSNALFSGRALGVGGFSGGTGGTFASRSIGHGHTRFQEDLFFSQGRINRPEFSLQRRLHEARFASKVGGDHEANWWYPEIDASDMNEQSAGFFALDLRKRNRKDAKN